MQKILIIIVISITSFLAGFFVNDFINSEEKIVIEDGEIKREKPLEKYQIDNLSQANIPVGGFETVSEEEEDKNKKFTKKIFSFEFEPAISGESKTTTGQINIPDQEGEFPLVVMLRGYVDQDLYTTGIGTVRGAAFFAENGLITLAPDFLGYAGSSQEAGNIFETRFQTYTTILSLLESINTDSFDQISSGKWDRENIFLWGHSNGGHISLTILEITGEDYPTTLWAPVSKPFPYSILYYTDESGDGGKFIRKELAKFEEIYDVDRYSLSNYLDRINAPIQIHQGIADGAVPYEWSDELVARLEDEEVDVTYYKYPVADHNLRPDWDTVVERDLEFFREKTEESNQTLP